MLRHCAFQETLMVLRHFFIAVIGTTMLGWSGVSAADEYRPDEFLSLNLSSAVLSPKPLGPAAGFRPGPLDVRIDGGNGNAQTPAEPAAGPKVEPRLAVHAAPVPRHRAEPARILARTNLAHHHHNPLDAQAFDARIQVWPCKSGGICNWKR
jgi:hypothetical protein